MTKYSVVYSPPTLDSNKKDFDMIQTTIYLYPKQKKHMIFKELDEKQKNVQNGR